MHHDATAQSATAILESLASRAALGRDDRIVCALLATIGHVHDIIQHLQPTPEEWGQVIGFLTEVGEATNARRQEWVLLSDVIGASTLVQDLHCVRPKGATPNTLAGPFYRPDAPDMGDGASISRDGIGEPLAVSGRITGLDGQAVGGAMIEVWQANSEGFYENQQPDQQPDFNLRGRFTANEAGEFRFTTVCPRGYSLPGDGPVGRLMARIGVTLHRPAHLHFRVTAAGFQTLTTHIYDRDDPQIGSDALFCVKPELLGDFRADAGATATRRLEVCLCLADTGTTGLSSTH